jgi:hypothetical protein
MGEHTKSGGGAAETGSSSRTALGRGCPMDTAADGTSCSIQADVTSESRVRRRVGDCRGGSGCGSNDQDSGTSTAASDTSPSQSEEGDCPNSTRRPNTAGPRETRAASGEFTVVSAPGLAPSLFFVWRRWWSNRVALGPEPVSGAEFSSRASTLCACPAWVILSLGIYCDVLIPILMTRLELCFLWNGQPA